MKLLYRTRGNSTPQGKPRVYYTGHPADLGAYAEEIFADILKSQNCAIWYDKEPEALADREEWQRELMQMQLIVVPVTSRFLYQPNRARDVEFPFAMERHIPVLPLIQEKSKNLVSDFNKRFGDLQMLNRLESDPTALPYEEKLEKFLSSVLVGDELAEKVRAAFDAYVFLSYRKKDRKYAQELMHLIHKNDFCRDIAIWYDEFLTPGENFNEAIGEALKKCALFALAVTPNIVENGNYVMAIEYPEAQKVGKPILPMEMETTDKQRLQNLFRDIPPCVDAHDEPALSAALLETLQRLAIRENDGSPEHDFFIGLAYLNGIDVEVDRTRALALITGAAEKGLPEAMEVLAAMYRGSNGIEQDYHVAIGWQKRLADLRKAQYEQNDTKDEGLSWIRALWTLGDYYTEAHEITDARKTYRQMLAISIRLTDLYDDVETKRYLSVSYRKLAGFRNAWSQHYWLQALELGKQLCVETASVEVRRDLFAVYDGLGSSSESEDRLSEAKKYYLQGLEFGRQLCEETGIVEVRRDLSVIYGKLGCISESEGRMDEAEAYQRQGMELDRQLYKETGAAEDGNRLCFRYSDLCSIAYLEERLTEAEEYSRQVLEMDAQLYEKAGTTEALRYLALCYKKVGRAIAPADRLVEAKGYYRRALELQKQLCEKTGSFDDWNRLLGFYNELGAICKAEGNLVEAKNYYAQDRIIRQYFGVKKYYEEKQYYFKKSL